MVFIRIKKIKGNEYAYLVKNNWQYDSSRQKVVGYLGRIYEFKEEKNLFEFDFQKGTFVQLCNSLIIWQLKNYGFEEKNGEYVKGKISFNPKKNSLKNNRGNDVVIKSHDGYLCEKTIKKLVGFKAKGYEDEAGYKLARSFVEAGIDIPKQIFIWAFEKVWKKTDEHS